MQFFGLSESVEPKDLFYQALSERIGTHWLLFSFRSIVLCQEMSCALVVG